MFVGSITHSDLKIRTENEPVGEGQFLPDDFEEKSRKRKQRCHMCGKNVFERGWLLVETLSIPVYHALKGVQCWYQEAL